MKASTDSAQVHGAVLSVAGPALELSGITAGYEQTMVLRDISFTVPKGLHGSRRKGRGPARTERRGKGDPAPGGRGADQTVAWHR
jgi:hypothetical protein